LSPRLHADPRYARRPRLRFAMGDADERHRADRLDDRASLRDRLREARAQQAAFETDHRTFCAAETQRTAAQFVLELTLLTYDKMLSVTSSPVLESTIKNGTCRS